MRRAYQPWTTPGPVGSLWALLELDAVLRYSVLTLLAGLLCLRVWAGALDYPLRVTSDTPTFIALVTGMAKRPFAEQSPFLAQQIATQHATPYIQAIAFLWSFLDGDTRAPIEVGRLLALVGIPVFGLLLWSVFLYVRRLAGSRAAWLCLPVLLGLFGPPTSSGRLIRRCMARSTQATSRRTSRSRFSSLPCLRWTAQLSVARARVPRRGDDDARTPVFGRAALRPRHDPGLLPRVQERARLLPGTARPGSRLRAGHDLACVLARSRVRGERGSAGLLRRSLRQRPSSFEDSHRSRSSPHRQRARSRTAHDGQRCVQARRRRRDRDGGRGPGNWRSSGFRRESRHVSRSTGWTTAGAGRSCSSRERRPPRARLARPSRAHRPRGCSRGLSGTRAAGAAGLPVPVWYRFLLLCQIPLAIGVATVLAQAGRTRMTLAIVVATFLLAISVKVVTLLESPGARVSSFGSPPASRSGRLESAFPPGTRASSPRTPARPTSFRPRRAYTFVTIGKGHVSSGREFAVAEDRYRLLRRYYAGGRNWWRAGQEMWRRGVRYVIVEKHTNARAPESARRFRLADRVATDSRAQERSGSSNYFYENNRVGTLVHDSPDYAVYRLDPRKLFARGRSVREREGRRERNGGATRSRCC